MYWPSVKENVNWNISILKSLLSNSEVREIGRLVHFWSAQLKFPLIFSFTVFILEHALSVWTKRGNDKDEQNTHCMTGWIIFRCALSKTNNERKFVKTSNASCASLYNRDEQPVKQQSSTLVSKKTEVLRRSGSQSRNFGIIQVEKGQKTTTIKNVMKLTFQA